MSKKEPKTEGSKYLIYNELDAEIEQFAASMKDAEQTVKACIEDDLDGGDDDAEAVICIYKLVREVKATRKVETISTNVR